MEDNLPTIEDLGANFFEEFSYDEEYIKAADKAEKIYMTLSMEKFKEIYELGGNIWDGDVEIHKEELPDIIYMAYAASECNTIEEFFKQINI